MFIRKTRKTFHVSTSRVYLVGKKSWLTRSVHFLRPYTSRAGYRMAGGSLVAL